MKAKDYAEQILELHAEQTEAAQDKIEDLTETLRKEAHALYAERVQRLQTGAHRFGRSNDDPRFAAILREACSKWDAVAHRIETKLGVGLFPFTKGGALIWPAIGALSTAIDSKDSGKIRENVKVVQFMQESLYAKEVKAYNVIIEQALDVARTATMTDATERLERAHALREKTLDPSVAEHERKAAAVELGKLMAQLLVDIDKLPSREQLVVYSLIGSIVRAKETNTVVESPP